MTHNPAPRELRDYFSETSEHASVDSSRVALRDLFAAGEEAILDNSKTYRVAARSSAILVVRKQKPAAEGRTK